MRTTSAASAILLAGLVTVGGCASSRTAGQRATDGLVKQVDQTADAVNRARDQIQTTLATYNTIMSNEAQDPRDAYLRLSKEIDRCDSLVNDVRSRTRKMAKTSDALFAQWAEAIETIQSPELKEQARKRMEATRAKFDEIVAALEQGRDAYEPFAHELNDQVTYLGFNLTPEAIKGLQMRANELNRDATAMKQIVDRLLAATEAYKATVTPAAPATSG